MNFVVVASTAAACAALTVVCLRRLLGRLRFQTSLADVLALAFGYGSLLLSYSVTFNNHVVAAGLFDRIANADDRGAGHEATCGAALWIGGLVGLAAVVDLPAGGAAPVAFGVWLAICHRGIPIAYAAGAAPFLLLHCVLQSLVTGSPLPAELYSQAFLFPRSYWTTPAGTFQEIGPRWQFGLEMLIGPQGWLTVTPVLVFGLAGAASVLIRPRDPLRGAALCVVAIFIIVFVYYIWFTRRTDFAGQSYGTRHLLAISPLVYYFAVVLLSRCRRNAAVALFTTLVLFGAVYALQGVKDPWTRIERALSRCCARCSSLRFIAGAVIGADPSRRRQWKFSTSACPLGVCPMENAPTAYEQTKRVTSIPTRRAYTAVSPIWGCTAALDSLESPSGTPRVSEETIRSTR